MVAYGMPVILPQQKQMMGLGQPMMPEQMQMTPDQKMVEAQQALIR